jgi:predicted phosphate transport protein (TIGR00153 family)
MKGDSLVKWFMPKEERFHTFFERDSKQLLAAVQMFQQVAETTSFPERRAKVAQLAALEKEGDRITSEIFSALNSTFITPLDREDIRSLASDLDDILDYLEGAAQYLILFEISESPEPLRKFAQILVQMVEQIDTATSLVWDLSNEKKIHEAIVRISALENEADALYFKVLGDLFREGSGMPPLQILKWKEVYQSLEDACDACKDYTHILGNVVVKNA